MERLTQWFGFGKGCRAAGIASHLEEKHTAEELVDVLAARLADYEDTGLEPDDIKAMYSSIEKVGAPLWRMEELAQADRDDRLVVLPCKVGGTVFRLITPKDGPATILETQVKTLGQAAELAGRVGKKRILISVFLTREEAEAALKGGGADV